jgi:endoglucanase
VGEAGCGDTHILLDAHLDQIGLIVTGIDKTGFLRVAKCGGADARVLAGHEVTVHGREKLFGVVCSTPPHLTKPEDKNKAVAFDKLGVDIGLSFEQASKLVSPGDRITLNGKFTPLLGTRVCSPALDDRAGIAVILRALDILSGKEHHCHITALFSVQEEVSGGGASTSAFSSRPDEAIAVDVSFALAPDCPPEKCGRLGEGVMIGCSPCLDSHMRTVLQEICASKAIPSQTEVMGGRTGTNADDISLCAGGIRTSLLSIPLRNMHTGAEIADTVDLEAAAQLIAEYILSKGGVENA